MKGILVAGLLSLYAGIACSQQLAVTFDDLPVHGELPPGTTRLEIVQSILNTWKREKLPPVYGFINDGRGEDDPEIGEPTGGTFLELMMRKKRIPFPENSKPYQKLEAMCR